MFVIDSADNQVNDHIDYTEIEEPHELFLNLPATGDATRKHTLKFLGCGWVDAYEYVLDLCLNESKQILVGKDKHQPATQLFENFKKVVQSETQFDNDVDTYLQNYQALTLLLQGKFKINAQSEPHLLNAVEFNQLRLYCLHWLWDSLARCNILSLYIDNRSGQRLETMSMFNKLREPELSKYKYIITAFQDSNIPSMLHCSMQKRLVHGQIEKFKRFHDVYHRQTTYANAGWKNAERQALLTTQRLFYENMILNKIQLATWGLNEMWGSNALEAAASSAKVQAHIKHELHGLSIEMLRCATKWLIFARHYSAEMKRIADRPVPDKRPQIQPTSHEKSGKQTKHQSAAAKPENQEHMQDIQEHPREKHPTPKKENLYEMLLKLSPENLKVNGKVATAQDLTLQPKQQHQQKINATFYLYNAAMKELQHDTEQNLFPKSLEDNQNDLQILQEKLQEAKTNQEKQSIKGDIRRKKKDIERAKKNAKLDEAQLQEQQKKAEELQEQQQKDLKLIKDILLTYEAIRQKYDTYLLKHQYQDDEKNRAQMLKQKNDFSSRRASTMQPS